MELKWTSKALSDLARLYDFLALASKPAAARTVQSLTQAPVILLTHPRRGLKPNGAETYAKKLTI